MSFVFSSIFLSSFFSLTPFFSQLFSFPSYPFCVIRSLLSCLFSCLCSVFCLYVFIYLFFFLTFHFFVNFPFLPFCILFFFVHVFSYSLIYHVTVIVFVFSLFFTFLVFNLSLLLYFPISQLKSVSTKFGVIIKQPRTRVPNLVSKSRVALPSEGVAIQNFSS